MSEFKIKYPANVAVHLMRNVKTGEQKVTTTVEKTKTKIENLKYESIKRWSYDAEIRVALIDVFEVSTEDEFKTKLASITELWEEQHG